MLEVKQAVIHDRERSKCDVIELINEWLVQNLSRECGGKSKEVLCRDVKNVLVKVVKNQQSVSSVSFSTVEEH
jgi:hypothetical protein